MYTVSIRLITYNQEKYIKQTIEGILIQKADFNIQVVVGDDFSNDKTLSLIQQYKNTENIHFKILERKVGDDYWKLRMKMGRLANFLNTLQHCEGEFIALLDGDDYWDDPFKLQKQVNFLLNNLSCTACFHDVCTVNEDNIVLRPNYFDSPISRYNYNDAITKYGGACATSALMFRAIVIKDLPRWFHKAISDYAMDILITQFGEIAHMNERMGAYRIHSNGVWQGNKNHKNLEMIVQRYRALLAEPKFENQFGEFLRKGISEQSRKIALAYREEKIISNQLKYAFYYYYYSAKNWESAKFILSMLKSIMVRNIFSQRFLA